MGKLAGLEVDLSVNNAGLRTGLDQAKGNLTGFSASVSKAVVGVQEMARATKRAANEVAQAGLGLAAVAGGAVALAASVDKGIANEVKNLKSAFTELAVPVAQLVVPAMRDFASGVRTVADFVAGLSPQTKGMISAFLEVAVVAGGAAMVVSKVAAAVSGLAAVVGAITAGPFVALVAGIAVVAAAALFLHKVWRENWGGIQEKTREVVQAIAGYWEEFKPWFSTFVDWLIDRWAVFEKALARAGNLVRVLTPGSGRSISDLGKDNRRSDAQIDAWAESMQHGGLAQAALDLGKKLKDGFVGAATSLKDELKLILDGFHLDLGKAKSFGGGTAGPTSTPTSGMDSIAGAAARASGMGAFAGSAAQVRINQAAAEFAQTIKVNSAFIDRGLKFAAQQRGSAEKGMTAQIEEGRQRLRERWEELLRDLRLNSIKLGEALQSQGRNIASRLGALGSIISAGVQGMQSGGPWGAVIGIVIELFTQLAGVMKVVDHLMEIFQRGLDRLDRAFTPLVQIFATIADTVEFLTECLEGIFDPITYIGIIFEAIGKTVTGTQLALMLLWRAILDGTGTWKHDALDKQINDIEAKMKKWSFDPADKFEGVVNKVEVLGDAVSVVAEQFGALAVNLPNGYKGLNAARFAADGSTRGGGAAPSPAWDGTMDFSGVGFDPGALLGSAYDAPWATPEGVLTGYGSTDLGGSGGTFVPGQGDNTGPAYSPANTWSTAQLEAFLAAYLAALSAGASEEQAVQAGTLAANGIAAGAGAGGGGGAGAGGGGGGGGGGMGAPPFVVQGDLVLQARDFAGLVKQVTETQTSQRATQRRNPHKAKK